MVIRMMNVRKVFVTFRVLIGLFQPAVEIDESDKSRPSLFLTRLAKSYRPNLLLLKGQI